MRSRCSEGEITSVRSYYIPPWGRQRDDQDWGFGNMPQPHLVGMEFKVNRESYRKASDRGLGGNLIVLKVELKTSSATLLNLA